ncbi:MAG: CoA-binding protein [Ignavibacteriae bacterium HGW-Ignavibacteriae-2]|jgi:hypothetical protein|nr:MAG: CoA-binding protein [Ignavibacteriae bacterium HGW-Ignavibacteriae-2]
MNYCEILKDAKTIAVVGLSTNPNKTSRNIARYLVAAGYKVYGVNPACKERELDGIPVFENLKEIPEKIDIVDVFRRSEDIPQIIPDVININPKVLWLQLGIKNDEAVKPISKKGITVVQDECIYIQHNNCY